MQGVAVDLGTVIGLRLRSRRFAQGLVSLKPVVCGPLERVTSDHPDSATCEDREQTPFAPPSIVFRSLPSLKFSRRNGALVYPDGGKARHVTQPDIWIGTIEISWTDEKNP